MNIWTCDFPNCNSSCTGVGGVVGLRAIGWVVVFYEDRTIKIRCPVHTSLSLKSLDDHARAIQEVLYSPTDKKILSK